MGLGYLEISQLKKQQKVYTVYRLLKERYFTAFAYENEIFENLETNYVEKWLIIDDRRMDGQNNNFKYFKTTGEEVTNRFQLQSNIMCCQ